MRPLSRSFGSPRWLSALRAPVHQCIRHIGCRLADKARRHLEMLTRRGKWEIRDVFADVSLTTTTQTTSMAISYARFPRLSASHDATEQQEGSLKFATEVHHDPQRDRI